MEISTRDAPWRTDRQYGGMSEESARKSYQASRASKLRLAELAEERPPDIEEPPPSARPEDFDFPSQGTAEPSTSITPAKRFIPIAIDDVTLSAEPAWAIHRLLPARGLACIVGPPKSGKSFLASDALFSIARGVPYAGRAVLQGPVIYLTGEGVSGFKRRLIALRRHHDVEGHGIPFFMIENVPDLGSETTNVHQLIAELDQCIKDRGLPPPRCIALDTLARCMGNGDENTAKDMGRVVDRFAIIERHYRCLVVPIHHMGKDPARKGRGSNALNGAADVTWEVEKLDGYSRVKIEEMKDGPEGATWTFRLLPVQIAEASATFDDGTETMTCVVEIMSEPALAQPSATKSKRPPTGVAGDLLTIIKHAIEEAGETNIDSVAAPQGARAVTQDMLKNYCRSREWQQDRKPNAFRAVLSNNLSKLRDRDVVGFDQRWIWLTP